MSLPRELERHFREEKLDALYDGDQEHCSRIDNQGSAGQLHAEQMPKVPSVVLTRARGRWSKPTPPELDDYWYAKHYALAEKLDAWHIFALDAGHRLNDEAPAFVAHAVVAVGEAAYR